MKFFIAFTPGSAIDDENKLVQIVVKIVVGRDMELILCKLTSFYDIIQSMTLLVLAADSPVLGQVPLPRRSSTIVCINEYWMFFGTSKVCLTGA